MKARSMKLQFALLLAAVSSIAVPVQAQELKIGYVNGERVLREAEPAKRAAAKLEAEFGKR
jgi:outer membrane protein